MTRLPAVDSEVFAAPGESDACTLPAAVCGTVLFKSPGVAASTGPAITTPKPKATKSPRLPLTIALFDPADERMSERLPPATAVVKAKVAEFAHRFARINRLASADATDRVFDRVGDSRHQLTRTPPL
jgi:hypothetical protein